MTSEKIRMIKEAKKIMVYTQILEGVEGVYVEVKKNKFLKDVLPMLLEDIKNGFEAHAFRVSLENGVCWIN